MRDRLRFEWLCRIAGRTRSRSCGSSRSVSLRSLPPAQQRARRTPPRPGLRCPYACRQRSWHDCRWRRHSATSAAAPQDPDPFAPETGTVLHPTVTQVVYARPGGPPVAALPVTELGSPTWVPVVQSQPGLGPDPAAYATEPVDWLDLPED